MNESVFNKGLPVSSSTEEELKIKSSSGRFSFFESRLFGVKHFIKRPSPQNKSDYQTLASLRKEYSIGMQIDHPGIVRYISFDGFSLNEEFIEGSTLQQLIESDDDILKDNSFIRSLCIDILNALEYIHSKGIVHQDIKPENIMITRIGRKIKIIDFGCAVSGSADEAQGFTPGYVAPEQLEGKANVFTDLYQTGKVIEVLTNNNPHLRKKWRRFITGCVYTDPNYRFPTAREAMRLVPFENSSSNKYYAVLIVGGLAFILSYVFWREKNDKFERENEMASQKEIPILSSQEPVIETTQEENKEIRNKIQQENVSPQQMLTAKITQELNAYYSKNVFPVYRNPEEYGFEANSENEAKALREVLDKGKTYSFHYGDSLVQIYPEYKEFIENKVYEKISENHNKVGIIYSRLLNDRNH